MIERFISWLVLVASILICCFLLAVGFALGRGLISHLDLTYDLGPHFIVIGYLMLILVETLLAVLLLILVNPIVEYFD